MAKLTLHIGANISGLKKGLASAMSSVKSIAGSFAGQIAGMFAVGKIAAFGKSAIDAADNIAKAAKRTGVSGEEFQRLSYAAELSGSSIDSVEKGIKKMTRTIHDAGRGLITSKDALAALGITLDDLQGKSTGDQFAMISAALVKVKDTTTKSALAMELFGRNGTELIPMLADYANLAAEFDASGNMISEENLRAAEEFNDSLTRIATTLKSSMMESGLVPWLADVAKGMEAVAGASKKLGSKTGIFNPGSSSYSGGVKGLALNLKDSLFGESEGVQITSRDTEEDARKLAENKKRLEAAGGKSTIQQREAAEAARKLKAGESAGIEAGMKSSKQASAEAMKIAQAEAKASEGVADAVKSLQLRIDLQKMLNAGKKREAEIQQAINDAEAKAGRELTAEERAGISAGAGELFDLSEKEERTAPLEMKADTASDALARIGGSLGGAIGGAANFDKANNAELKGIREIMRDLNSKANATGGMTWV